jgi:hypothetical protein
LSVSSSFENDTKTKSVAAAAVAKLGFETNKGNRCSGRVGKTKTDEHGITDMKKKNVFFDNISFRYIIFTFAGK